MYNLNYSKMSMSTYYPAFKRDLLLTNIKVVKRFTQTKLKTLLGKFFTF